MVSPYKGKKPKKDKKNKKDKKSKNNGPTEEEMDNMVKKYDLKKLVARDMK